MAAICDGKHTFELVDSVPRGYMIWSIGKNMIDGYLPLCRLKRPSEQPFEGGRAIEPDTLKAIKVDGAQTILAAVGYGPDDIPSMERYVKRYGKSEKPVTRRRVERMKAALEIMYTLKWE